MLHIIYIVFWQHPHIFCNSIYRSPLIYLNQLHFKLSLIQIIYTLKLHAVHPPSKYFSFLSPLASFKYEYILLFKTIQIHSSSACLMNFYTLTLSTHLFLVHFVSLVEGSLCLMHLSLKPVLAPTAYLLLHWGWGKALRKYLSRQT